MYKMNWIKPRFITCVFCIFTPHKKPLTYIGSVGKEDAAVDGHSYHAYTYMIAFTCLFNSHFVIVYELLYFHFNKVPRSIVDDMYLINVTNVVQYIHYII